MRTRLVRAAGAATATMVLLAATCGGDGAAVDEPAAQPTAVPVVEADGSEQPTPTPASTSEPTPMPDVAPGGADLQAVVETSLVTDAGTTDLVGRLDDLAVPGVAVAIVVDGTVTAFAAGETPDGRPMTPSTISQVGSVSKPVAALTALSLAAEGRIDLDVDIEGLLTSYDLPIGAQSPDNPVTVAGLLAHAAGVNVDGFLGYGTPESAPTLPQVLAGVGNSEAIQVVQAPGVGFLYSGGGYSLLEQTLVDVTGSTWNDLVTAQIFEPVGMVDSFYSTSLDEATAARATAGSIAGNELANRWQAHPEGAAAGLWTTAADLGALLAAFLESLSGSDAGILPPAWARRSIEPTTPVDDVVSSAQGFFVDDPAEPSRWFHSGRNLGYDAEVFGAVDGSFAVAVITNGFPNGSQLVREIIRTVDTAITSGS